MDKYNFAYQFDKIAKLAATIGLVWACSNFNAAFAANINNTEDLMASLSHKQYAQNIFTYNPKTLIWKAIKDGKVIRSGRGSGGKGYCPDVKRSCRTPTGSFRVISKGGAGCRSSRYPVGRGGAPMPYCMFFSRYYAIHGSPDVPNHNASHGCIRVRPSAAKWLYNNFIRIGTKVIVKSY